MNFLPDPPTRRLRPRRPVSRVSEGRGKTEPEKHRREPPTSSPRESTQPPHGDEPAEQPDTV